MNYPFDKFQYIANLIIDNLEGGYYHPDMYIKGAKTTSGKFIPAATFVKADYGRSGETLFGLDRHAGWNLWYRSKRLSSSPQENLKYIYSNRYQFIDDYALKFWTTLDKLDARNKFAWGYDGGIYRDMLKDLCIKMMYQYFLKNVWNKLDDKGKILVINDNKLALNYIYSAWNGIAYSNYYNGIFNTQIAKGVTDTTTINNAILNARATSKSGLIRDSATKIKKVFPKIKTTTTTTQPVEKKKRIKMYFWEDWFRF
jgi:hypothetical protein